jgi:hypothetical protein
MSYNYEFTPGSPNTDRLVHYEEKPDINYLSWEFRRSLYSGNNMSRIDDNDAVRFCKWSGQTDDGKKWSNTGQDGKQVFPFEGASDIRVRLIDSTINELVATLTTSFERADLKVSGVDIQDAAAAEAATNLMTWIRENKMKQELQRESELLAQYCQQYGWAVVHVAWEQKISKRIQTITMQQIQQLVQQTAQQDPQSPLLQLPAKIMSEEHEDEVIAIFEQYLPDVYKGDLRKMVRDLRTTGTGEYEEEYVQKNLPSVAALKPFDEVAFPPETINLQDARVIFRRQYMTEVQMRSMIVSDGWDEEFVNQAALTQGRQSWFNDINLVSTALNTAGALRTDHLIEVVYAYVRQIDEKGVPAIYFTVFCPLVGNQIFGKHELLDYAHGNYPFVDYRRERLRRRIMESRGIPELSSTDQDEIKAQADSMRDRTAFTTLPPIKVKKRIGMINKIGPAVQLPVTQADDYEFMTPPASVIGEAVQVMDRAYARHANYFGLSHEAVSPVKAQLIQQQNLNNWFGTWSIVFSQVFQLCLQYLPEEEIQRVTGSQLPKNISDIAGQFDFILRFDVRDLNPDYVLEKLKAISQFVVPLDTGGVIDRNKLIMAITEAISPTAATDLITDQTSASQKMYRDVQSDIALMMLGTEAMYTQNDPAAQTKLQYAQDVVTKNPKAQQAAKSDPLFQKLMENYVKNLQMSIMQQQNKQIGAYGVKPVES